MIIIDEFGSDPLELHAIKHAYLPKQSQQNAVKMAAERRQNGIATRGPILDRMHLGLRRGASCKLLGLGHQNSQPRGRELGRQPSLASPVSQFDSHRSIYRRSQPPCYATIALEII